MPSLSAESISIKVSYSTFVLNSFSANTGAFSFKISCIIVCLFRLDIYIVIPQPYVCLAENGGKSGLGARMGGARLLKF